MVHPLVTKILSEGLDKIDVSMLSAELRNRLLSEAGTRLLAINKVKESSDAYALAGNAELLREQGDWFKAQQKYAQAALFLRHVAEREELEELAAECLRRGHTSAAKEIFLKLNDSVMVSFIDANFR